jgi:pimeloyl-ACP methyl ester carboxylesterase
VQSDLDLVLLVHGYNGTPEELALLARALRASGRTVVAVRLPARGTASLDESADALAAEMAGGISRVDLVGYSLGGLVIRTLLARSPRTASRVNLVVTMATPYGGVDLSPARGARCTDANACGQLRPGSTALRRLAAAPLPGRWVALYSADDVLVTPARARLEGAVNIAVDGGCPAADLGHLEMRDSRLVREFVTAVLAGSSPNRALATACVASGLR